MGAAATMLVVSTALFPFWPSTTTTFQLDGDVIVARRGRRRRSPFDWDSFFTRRARRKTRCPAGFTAATFSVDFDTEVNRKRRDRLQHVRRLRPYTTGSKDTLDINPGWQCAASNNVLSKNDIMNAYSAAFTDPVHRRHQILYFGMERNSNNGDAQRRASGSSRATRQLRLDERHRHLVRQPRRRRPPDRVRVHERRRRQRHHAYRWKTRTARAGRSARWTTTRSPTAATAARDRRRHDLRDHQRLDHARPQRARSRRRG